MERQPFQSPDQARDVFLSYNSEDFNAVHLIAQYLRDVCGIDPWFDHWHLIPGEPWLPELGRALKSSKICAVFIGQSGEGPWQRPEIEVALNNYVANAYSRVIPVLLPDAPEKPDLPIFLEGFTWVDFRPGINDPGALWRLECGITGHRPEKGRAASKSLDADKLAEWTAFVDKSPKISLWSEAQAPDVFRPGGAISINSPYYVERDADHIIRQALRGEQAMITLRGARQSGKTSLLLRACHTASAAGICTAFIDLQSIPHTEFQSRSTIWRFITKRIAHQLSIRSWSESDWNNSQDYHVNTTNFIVNHVIANHQRPFLFCFDECDRVFSTSLRSEFFASIRAFWTDSASAGSVWAHSRWLLAAASEPSVFIEDRQQSPFNIADPIVELPNFNRKETAALVAKFDLSPKSDLDGIIEFTGGRPILVHTVLYQLKRSGDPLKKILNSAAAEPLYRNHLRGCLRLVEGDPKLKRIMHDAVNHRTVRGERRDIDALTAAGLLHPTNAGRLAPACRLYTEFFKKELGSKTDADFKFQAGGPLKFDAPSYIERPADDILFSTIKNREICLMFAPRQTGKSSLMMHARQRLLAAGRQVGTIDLQRLGNEANEDRFYNSIINQMLDSLALENAIPNWRDLGTGLSSTDRFRLVIIESILKQTSNDVVIFVDEVDSIFKLPFSDGFFTGIRSLYNEQAMAEDLRRIIFVLIGVATASELVKDRTRTPFNVGVAIRLEDFSLESMLTKLTGTGRPFQREMVERIHYWTGGQPYLVQRLAGEIAASTETKPDITWLDVEVDRRFSPAEIQSDTHLKYIRDYILSDFSTLRNALRIYRQILKGDTVGYDDQSEYHSRLLLSGLVKNVDGNLTVRNQIYKRLFNLEWVNRYAVEQAFVCTQCNASNDENAEKCQTCGTLLVRRCPECASEQKQDHKYCHHCGNNLDSYFMALEAVEEVNKLSRDHHWNTIVRKFAELPSKLTSVTKKSIELRDHLARLIQQAESCHRQGREFRNSALAANEAKDYEIALTLAKQCLHLNPRDQEIRALTKALPDRIRQRDEEHYRKLISLTPELLTTNEHDTVEERITAFLQEFPKSPHVSELTGFIECDLPLLKEYHRFLTASTAFDREIITTSAAELHKKIESHPDTGRQIFGTRLTAASIFQEVGHVAEIHKRMQESPISKIGNDDNVTVSTSKKHGNPMIATFIITLMVVVIMVIAYMRIFASKEINRVRIENLQPVIERAETLWQKAKKLESSQQIGKEQRRIEELYGKIEQRINEKEYHGTQQIYLDIISAIHKLLGDDTLRMWAKEKRDEATSAKMKAKQVNSKTNGKREWDTAMSSFNAGVERFEAGDFVHASEQWTNAELQFGNAELRALAVDNLLRDKQAIIPLKEKAESALRNVQKWDTGEGFARRIAEVKSKFDSAIAFIEAKAFSEATNQFQTVVNRVSELENLNGAREKSVKERAKADQTKNQAELAQTPKFADELWDAAHDLYTQAEISFAASDFASAEATWRKAVQAFFDATVESYVKQGKEAVSKNDWKRAQEFATKALGLAPELESARDLKSKAYTQLTKPSGPVKGEPWTIPDLGMKLVYIKKGTFMMGSKNGDDDEKPEHKVEITKYFWIAQHETTIKDYLYFLNNEGKSDGVDWQDDHCPISNTNGSYRIRDGETKFWKTDKQPMIEVSWFGANDFCTWLNKNVKTKKGIPTDYEYRLPTEAEWEYVCRAGKRESYSFGDDQSFLYKYGNFCDVNCLQSWKDGNQDDTFVYTAEVKNLLPNPWGLYDMHGNVWEWCLDRADYQSGKSIVFI